MIEFYAQIRAVHIGAVLTSGTLFANHWLTVKLALLVLYVVLGSVALKRGRTLRMRAICFAAAVAVYLGMLGIARTHQPLGWFSA